MSHHEAGGWEMKGVTDVYNGFEVHDHGIAPREMNVAQVDGDVSFDSDAGETDYFLPEFVVEE